jgi:BlaI family penicillinase repressor
MPTFMLYADASIQIAKGRVYGAIGGLGPRAPLRLCGHKKPATAEGRLHKKLFSHHFSAFAGSAGRMAFFATVTPLLRTSFHATYCSVTWSYAMSDDTLPDLGDLEREVMQLIWAGRSMTAEAVREQLPRRLKESTVRTVLRRLEEKGYVTHMVDGRTYVFQATKARRQVAANAVRRIVDRFCDGSVEEVLVGMVDAKMFDRRQLDMLREKIAKAKKRR